jgi:hypothetical protein
VIRAVVEALAISIDDGFADVLLQKTARTAKAADGDPFAKGQSGNAIAPDFRMSHLPVSSAA